MGDWENHLTTIFPEVSSNRFLKGWDGGHVTLHAMFLMRKQGTQVLGGKPCNLACAL
jgi:hypothetical protein